MTVLVKNTQMSFIEKLKRKHTLSGIKKLRTTLITVINLSRRLGKHNTFDSLLKEWLGNCGSRGITIESVWYSPKSIERIELGERVLERL